MKNSVNFQRYNLFFKENTELNFFTLYALNNRNIYTKSSYNSVFLAFLFVINRSKAC